MKVWIDISNLPQAPFFWGLLPHLEKEGAEVTFTAHGQPAIFDFLEMKGVETWNRRHRSRHFGLGYGMKFLSGLRVPKFDLAVSFENLAPFVVAKARRKKAVVLMDNDLKLHAPGLAQRAENVIKRRYPRFLVPEVALSAFAPYLPATRLGSFAGLKEHVTLSGFEADAAVAEAIPFDDFVIVRPESPVSTYVARHTSFTAELLAGLVEEGHNVVYLPRNSRQRALATSDAIHVPERVFDGMTLISLSEGVLTGSGTMAREAAVMGKPAVSFFPNDELLAVDRWLVGEGRMWHGRDVEGSLGALRLESQKESATTLHLARKIANKCLSLP